ncbi:hypothetical protein PRIC1_008468 [Phytophthora ramorum]
MQERLASELVDLFHTHLDAVDIAVADQWAHRIHSAFYCSQSTRGNNKFLALEATLAQVFTCLSIGANAHFFWDFAVHVVLILAREPTPAVPDADTCQPEASTSKKGSRKRQPNVPLAFVAVNALRKIVNLDESREQMELCLLQGRHNEELRAFCMRGLGADSDVDLKLLVELVGLFQITDVDCELVRKALDHLLASKSHAALIKLCETFADVDWPFESIVASMVQAKDWTSAELFVRTFERDGDTALANILIEKTIHVRDFKRAHRFVLTFNLQKQYPDIDVLYSRDGLMRLMDTQRWQLALTFVGQDITLQKMLLKHMFAAGELEHAAQLGKKMLAAGFEPDSSQIIQRVGETLGSDQLIAEGAYLMLPQDSNVIFCASEDTLRQAMEYFFEARTQDPQLPIETKSTIYDTQRVVGLDVEWKPITSRFKTTTAVASILQIATLDQVFIVDLLALHDNNFLFDNFLLRLFTSPQWLKLGFSFDSDLKVLQQTFPERQAFTTVSPFLDLNELGLKSGVPVGTSLSQSVHRILGKALDKRMQLSDWERRPLSSEQLNYAALDAACLTQVVTKLQGQDGCDSSLLSWSEVCQNIGDLTHPTSLTEAEVLEAVSVRFEYQKTWHSQCILESEVHHATLLVNPHDIARMWNEQKTSRAHEVEGNFDTALKFLPMEQITAMLETSENDIDTRDFMAVNSICILVDDTPSVVCIDASCKLDMAQFARFCGVGRRKVRLATAAECRDVFGFTPGTVAPFGHKVWISPSSTSESAEPQRIEVYADSRLQSTQYLAAGSGSEDEVIWVESKAFFALISINLVGDISIPRDSSRSFPTRSDANYGGVTFATATDKEPQILENKFLVDSMVTQVGRWLRTIGVDVVAWNPADAKATRSNDPKSTMLAYAAKHNRIILTRDTGLPSRRDAGACFVLSDDECYKQFREVKVQFGLLDQVDTLSSRCARCNSDTFSPIDATSARKKLSERLRKKVPNSVTKFWTCQGCGRIYWEGPKYTPSINSGAKTSPDGQVVYRPVPRKRVAGARHDQRHLPDLLS